MNHCANCKWSLKPSKRYSLRCLNPKVSARSSGWLATGEAEDAVFCSTERSGSWVEEMFSPCGRKGKLWAGKPTEDKYGITANENLPEAAP